MAARIIDGKLISTEVKDRIAAEVAEYVESLEEAQDTADLPEARGDAIAKEFERYLRRRGTDEQ